MRIDGFSKEPTANISVFYIVFFCFEVLRKEIVLKSAFQYRS